MDKSTILRTFLSLGAQVDKDALDILVANQEVLERALKTEKNKLPSVITSEFLKTLSQIALPTEKISVNQLSLVLNYRYEFLRKILAGKTELTNLISMNKVSEKLKQFSVIGVVVSKTDILTLEDSTGQAGFLVDKESARYVIEDEVIGIVCERRGETNHVKSIVYPDIPLRKEASKYENLKNCIFISDIHMDSPKFDENHYKNLLNWLEEQKDLKIFVIGGISKKRDDITRFLSDVPTPLQIYSEETISKSLISAKVENIQIAVTYGTFLQYYMNLWSTPASTTLLNLIKKRNLNPVITPDFYDNAFLLENIPDILVVGGTGKAETANYKGTTILTNGGFLTEPIYWLINLRTRETFKIDFS